MISLTFSNYPIDEIEERVFLLPLYEDIHPLPSKAGLADWRLNGKISSLILNSKFVGKRGDGLLMPSDGRLSSQELFVLGLGPKPEMNEFQLSNLVQLIVSRLILKKARSVTLSLSDYIEDMFAWRNAVRLLVSMLSSIKEGVSITLCEDKDKIIDAQKRQMDFSPDVKVSYLFYPY